jgi:hypothetical protein
MTIVVGAETIATITTVTDPIIVAGDDLAMTIAVAIGRITNKGPNDHRGLMS